MQIWSPQKHIPPLMFTICLRTCEGREVYVGALGIFYVSVRSLSCNPSGETLACFTKAEVFIMGEGTLKCKRKVLI